jgi:hypothetical protein
VGNRPNLLSCREHATYRWKALDEGYNFALDYILIRGLFLKLWGSKVARVPTDAISRFPLGSPGREKPFRCRLRGQACVSEWNLSILLSPIPELQHAFLPFKVLWTRERALTPSSSVVFYLDSHLNPSRSWECVMQVQG